MGQVEEGHVTKGRRRGKRRWPLTCPVPSVKKQQCLVTVQQITLDKLTRNSEKRLRPWFLHVAGKLSSLLEWVNFKEEKCCKASLASSTLQQIAQGAGAFLASVWAEL